MATQIIGEVIHGGPILVRQQVSNMYPHLSREDRERLEADVLAVARTAFPWAPRVLTATYGQGKDYHYYLTVTLAVPDRVRYDAVQERLRAAEDARCACGDHGSWDHSISGTSGGRPCVWAGCQNCDGQTLGRPILAKDLSWFDRRQAKAAR